MPRYIDADALKDVIQQHDYPLADRLNSVDNGMFTLGIFQAIDKQPTISPDEVRGVWKWERINYTVGHDYKCLACGKLNDRASNYCPDCGKPMRMKGAEVKDGTTDTEKY